LGQGKTIGDQGTTGLKSSGKSQKSFLTEKYKITFKDVKN